MSGLLLSIGAGIVVLGVLILLHELGHFIAAKSVGIAVLRFSVGFGPPTPLRFVRGETEYCLSWIPVGGYVKMAGAEDEETPVEGPRQEVQVEPERCFDNKPLWARVWVVSAGVLANALFAFVTYAALARVYGTISDPTTTVARVVSESLPMGAAPLETLLPGDRILRINGDTMATWDDIQAALLTAERTPIRLEIQGRSEPVLVDVPLSEQESRIALVRSILPQRDPVLGRVVEGKPAAAAGLLAGDRVLVADEDSLATWDDLVQAVSGKAGARMDLTVLRGADTLAVSVTPQAVTERGVEVGRIGVEPVLNVQRHGLAGSVRQGLVRSWEGAGLIIFTLKGMLFGTISPKDLGGPILVGQISGEVARLGLQAFLAFMALFSINLAVLNLLPIPVLDGGQLVFLFVEGVRRRPLSLEQRQRLTQVGVVLLVALMVFAIANDLTRLFR